MGAKYNGTGIGSDRPGFDAVGCVEQSIVVSRPARIPWGFGGMMLERISKRIARAEARAKTAQARRAKQAYQREIRRWSATKLAAFAAGRCQKKPFLRCAHIRDN